VPLTTHTTSHLTVHTVGDVHAGFYMLFHCLLNVTAELLRFSDRKFFDGEALRWLYGWCFCADLTTMALHCARLVERHVAWRVLAQVEHPSARVVPPPRLHRVAALLPGPCALGCACVVGLEV